MEGSRLDTMNWGRDIFQKIKNEAKNVGDMYVQTMYKHTKIYLQTNNSNQKNKERKPQKCLHVK